MRVALAIAALAGLAGWSSPVAACSMAPGYKVPTNLELAARADAIVLATITGERRGKDADAWDGVVLAQPTLLLKGGALPPTVEIAGAYLARDEQARRMVMASDPRELRRPNPGALIGGCVRYIFAPDMQLVLFLKREADGRLTPLRSSFSRDAEDVPGPDAAWVRAVREYATIGSLPRRAWKARLAARAAELRATGDADAALIAADMDVERTGRRLPNSD